MITDKKTALVIDDDRMLGEPLCTTLESLGFETTYCDSGSTALGLAKEKCFAVILIDYRMPEMDGAKVTQALRLQCPRAFIIGLSAENKRAEFVEAGADTFFTKPFPFNELYEVIQKRIVSS